MQVQILVFLWIRAFLKMVIFAEAIHTLMAVHFVQPASLELDQREELLPDGCIRINIK